MIKELGIRHGKAKKCLKSNVSRIEIIYQFKNISLVFNFFLKFFGQPFIKNFEKSLKMHLLHFFYEMLCFDITPCCSQYTYVLTAFPTFGYIPPRYQLSQGQESNCVPPPACSAKMRSLQKRSSRNNFFPLVPKKTKLNFPPLEEEKSFH